MKTISFNTGRLYAADGQFIVATLHNDGVVTFTDHSRCIDGEYVLAEGEAFSAAAVMTHYDYNEYKASKRSREDGMRSGCNARPQ